MPWINNDWCSQFKFEFANSQNEISISEQI